MESSLCPTEVLSFGAALIGMAAAGVALKAAAETAVRLIPVQWYSRAHGLVQRAGLDRMTCLLGCLGLCLALLCVACATAAPALVRKRTMPFLETAGVGLTIFLGCAVSGSLLGWTCATLTALGLRGFCLFGFIFGLILLFVNKRQIAEAPSRMLVLHTVTLLIMYLGVWSGRVVDIRKPRLCLVNVLLAPAAGLMGLLVTTLMLSRCRHFIIFTFVLLVPVSGMLFGLETERHAGEEPLLHHTHSTIQFSVYTLEILTGILGTLGGMYVRLGAPGRAGGLACWISVPAAVTLFALDLDSPHTHTDVLSVAQGGVGAAGLLGFTSGLAAASGVALGIAIVSAAEVLWPAGALLLEDVQGAGWNNPYVAADAVENFAVLAVVMMGSAVLGVAQFLTASLGSSGLMGTVLAAIITILKALYMLSEYR